MGDRKPMFQGDIDAEMLDISIETPSSEGFVKINDWTQYHNHTVVFAHFAEGGQLKTTHMMDKKRNNSKTLSKKTAELMLEPKSGK